MHVVTLVLRVSKGSAPCIEQYCQQTSETSRKHDMDISGRLEMFMKIMAKSNWQQTMCLYDLYIYI